MKIDQLRSLIEQQSSKYNGLRAKKTMLKEQLEDRSHYNYGVKTILSTNLNGIIGIVEQMIVPKENYELAISTALGSAMQFVLTKDQSSARNAISYLKQNRAGRQHFYLSIPFQKEWSVMSVLSCSKYDRIFKGLPVILWNTIHVIN